MAGPLVPLREKFPSFWTGPAGISSHAKHSHICAIKSAGAQPGHLPFLFLYLKVNTPPLLRCPVQVEAARDWPWQSAAGEMLFRNSNRMGCHMLFRLWFLQFSGTLLLCDDALRVAPSGISLENNAEWFPGRRREEPSGVGTETGWAFRHAGSPLIVWERRPTQTGRQQGHGGGGVPSAFLALLPSLLCLAASAGLRSKGRSEWEPWESSNIQN